MLAKLSIRAKLVAVVSLLLISLAAMGAFGLLQMRSQNVVFGAKYSFRSSSSY